MKIKLKDLEKPITQMWCFKHSGYCSSLIEKINSGKEVKVEKVPKPALEYVEEIKTIKKQKNKGDE